MPAAEAARDEVDEEDHVRHEADGVERVLDVERLAARSRRGAVEAGGRRGAAALARSAGPAAPRQRGQQRARARRGRTRSRRGPGAAAAAPRARGDDAETDAGEDGAAREPAPRRPARAAARWARPATISAPPATPEAKRQTKNHENDSGSAQAKNATVASAIIARSTRRRAAARAPCDGAQSAPAR